MLAGPAGLPAPVRQTLDAALARALQNPELRQKLEASGSTVMDRQPDLAAFMAEEAAKYQRIVQFARIEQ